MKRLLLGFLALAAWAQPNLPRYAVYRSTTLTASAEKVTVQQVTGQNSKAVQFDSAVVYCSVACVVTLSQNGTAATTTTASIVPLNLSPTSTTGAYYASNASGGNTISTYSVPAGATWVIDLKNLYLPANASSGANLSIGTNSISGDVKISVFWSEQ